MNDMRDHFGFMLFHHESDEQSSAANREAWDSMLEYEREGWRDRAAEKIRAYEAMTPAMKTATNLRAHFRQIRKNDATFPDDGEPV